MQGKLDPQLRSNFYVYQSHLVPLVNELKSEMGIGSVFSSVYQELLKTNNTGSAQQEALNKQIEIDLHRTKNPITDKELSSEAKE